MERLTNKNFKLGFDDSNKLPSYESIYERLRYYEDMKEDGRMSILPCKIGDTVYVIRNSFEGIKVDKKKFSYAMIGKIGTKVFLTEQEVNKALDGMKE